MDQHKYELKKAVEYIPRRILELTLEIDKLKLRFQEVHNEYMEICYKEQKETMDLLDISLNQMKIKKEEFMKKVPK